MPFVPVDEVAYDPREPSAVYAEGWQTWSRVRSLRLGDHTPPAPDEQTRKIVFRPGEPLPPNVIQAEGVLAIGERGRGAQAWFAPDPARQVATLRVTVDGARAVISADGPVARLEAADLDAALRAVGERLRSPSSRVLPPGWCSWSCYFKDVTEADVLENVHAAQHLALPIAIAQIDDGYEPAIGDWLDVDPRFGSLPGAARAIRAAGMVPGIWVAPFLVDPRSHLAATHPDWLVPGLDAGDHWGARMRILDLARRDAGAYLREVFATFVDWGFGFFKLDFLYAGAITGLAAYREGLMLIRDAVGPEAVVLACGAPLLPSIGLCDAMRVGPDVLPEVPAPQLDVETLIEVTSLRSWMNGRLWVNDPDHLVARPQVTAREAWARHVAAYGGVRFSGDRLAALDARGLELTREALSKRA